MRHDETPQSIQEVCTEFLMRWNERTNSGWEHKIPKQLSRKGSCWTSFLTKLGDLITTLTPTLSNTTTSKMKKRRIKHNENEEEWHKGTKHIIARANSHFSSTGNIHIVYKIECTLHTHTFITFKRWARRVDWVKNLLWMHNAHCNHTTMYPTIPAAEYPKPS